MSCPRRATLSPGEKRLSNTALGALLTQGATVSEPRSQAYQMAPGASGGAAPRERALARVAAVAVEGDPPRHNARASSIKGPPLPAIKGGRHSAPSTEVGWAIFVVVSAMEKYYALTGYDVSAME
jgi:hypothetical protein